MESKGIAAHSVKDIAIPHLSFAFVHSKILTNSKISALRLIYIFLSIFNSFVLLNDYMVNLLKELLLVQTGSNSMLHYKLAKTQTDLSLKIM